MIVDIGPFVLALLLLLGQFLTDDDWKVRFQAVLHRHVTGNEARSDIEAAAEWGADAAAFVPAAALTFLGALILVSVHHGLSGETLTVVGVVGAIAIYLLYRVATHSDAAPLMWRPLGRTRLWWLLLALNIAGLIIAVVVHDLDPVGETPVPAKSRSSTSLTPPTSQR